MNDPARSTPTLAQLVLKQPRGRETVRDHVEKVVASNPGCTFREGRALTRLSKRQFKRAVDDLVACNALFAFRMDASQYLFPNSPGIEAACTQILALRNQERLRLHAWLLEHGPIPQASLIQHAAREWNWPMVSAKKRLAHLIDARLVEREGWLAADLRTRWLRALQPPALFAGLKFNAVGTYGPNREAPGVPA